MIIKHVEFNVICNGCWSDMTDWKAVPKDTLRRYAKKEGIKLGYMDACLCEDCQKEMEELSQKASEMNENIAKQNKIPNHPDVI